MNKLILSAAALLALSAPAFAESDNLELQAQRNGGMIEASQPVAGAAEFGITSEVGAPTITFDAGQDTTIHGRPTWSGDR